MTQLLAGTTPKCVTSETLGGARKMKVLQMVRAAQNSSLVVINDQHLAIRHQDVMFVILD